MNKIGDAFLPSGEKMDYKDYLQTQQWQAVRVARLKFDNYQCVVCHRPLSEFDHFECHHLNYSRLGSEHIRDVITLCSNCHATFHNNWQKQQYWKGREPSHWDAYSLHHTAVVCASIWQHDKLISKNIDDPNLCSKNELREVIDKYLEMVKPETPTIDYNDVLLFVRNKRWDLVLDAEDRGLTIEQFLDEYYGPKQRGKNPIRAFAASNASFKHELKSIHRHYKENKNLNKLMEESLYVKTKQLF